MSADSTSTSSRIRPFDPDDAAACLDIFDSNLPDYFVDNERDLFAAFLNRNDCPFLVIEQADQRMIACGGYAVDVAERTGRMCWGMVSRSHHRRGFGWLLLADRLMAMYQAAGSLTVGMDTSHRTVGFFQEFGFVSLEYIPDGYGPGLHKHEMSLKLDDSVFMRLSALRAERLGV